MRAAVRRVTSPRLPSSSHRASPARLCQSRRRRRRAGVEPRALRRADRVPPTSPCAHRSFRRCTRAQCRARRRALIDITALSFRCSPRHRSPRQLRLILRADACDAKRAPSRERVGVSIVHRARRARNDRVSDGRSSRAGRAAAWRATSLPAALLLLSGSEPTPAISRGAVSEPSFRSCIGLAENVMIVLVTAARAMLAAPRRGGPRHHPSLSAAPRSGGPRHHPSLCCFSRRHARSVSRADSRRRRASAGAASEPLLRSCVGRAERTATISADVPGSRITPIRRGRPNQPHLPLLASLLSDCTGADCARRRRGNAERAPSRERAVALGVRRQARHLRADHYVERRVHRRGCTAERRPTSSSRALLCCSYVTTPAPTSQHDDGEREAGR